MKKSKFMLKIARLLDRPRHSEFDKHLALLCLVSSDLCESFWMIWTEEDVPIVILALCLYAAILEDQGE